MSTAAPVDFTQLSEAEQREVAERLLKIEESGWKPFWCSLKACTTGDPHPLLDEHGAVTFVSDDDRTGPNGEPVADYFYDSRKDTYHTALDPAKVWPHEEYQGRVLLDPKWSHNHARRDQRLPGWLKPWTLFVMSGRGTGKTRVGVEFVTLCARKGLDGAILGRRGTELVNTHVAGLIEHAHPEFVPIHYASKDILVWPNGAITYLFSAEKPENIRSVNLSYAWVDEAAFMDEIETAWMNLKLATRIEKSGNPIHFLITSTPTSTPWVMKMEDSDEVEVRRVSTYANRANLSTSFIADLEREYEGTRMGRQELHGEVLRDVEGALWNDDIFVHRRIEDIDAFDDLIASLDDVVVAVDPAGSKGPRSDATGIIAVGAHHFDDDGSPLSASRFSVIGDGTVKGTPTEWARATYRLARHVSARRIIAEKNFGGEMVKQVLDDFAKIHPDEAVDADGENFRIEVVHAAQSKETRAEGTVGKYEQGRVTHITSTNVYGDLAALEKEQTSWVPKSRGGRSPSPNRVDALVWAVRALEAKVRFAGTMASRTSTLAKLKPRTHPGVGGSVHSPTPTIPEARPRAAVRLDNHPGAQRSFPTKPRAKRVVVRRA